MATEVVVSTGSPSPHALLSPSPEAPLTADDYAHSRRRCRARRVELGGILVDQIDLAGRARAHSNSSCVRASRIRW